MKNISDEDLIGYLLGALEPEEARLIESALEQSLELREQLASIEEKLAELPNRFVEMDPPPGLAEKTLNTIDIVDSSLAAGGKDSSQLEPASRQAAKFSNSASNPDFELQHRNGSWSVADMIVGVVVCFVLAVVLLPSIANSRFESNLAHCQNNLRTIGYNLGNLADSYDGRFAMPKDADEWHSSFFIQRMFEAGLAGETETFICPNDPDKQETAAICQQAWGPMLVVAPGDKVMPPSNEMAGQEFTANQLDSNEANLAQSTEWECNDLRQSRAASGSYGFAAPPVMASGMVAIAVPGSRNTVLSADAACLDNPGYLSRNHGGRGQNVLLGDLSVEYISETACLPTGDHIYTNNQGRIQPGMLPDDNLIYKGTIWIENLVYQNQ